ncbi:hypothetical protein ACFL1G_07400, partial [Planctomycetota bacterium]
IQEDKERLRAEPNIKTVRRLQQQTAQNQTGSQKLIEESKPLFKELAPEQEAHAEQLYEYALSFRSMGRLPVVSYKQMVDICRQIIELYPDSEYAYKAKRMLGDIPEQYRKQYNITDGEIVIEE